MLIAQQWLEQNYPDKNNTREITLRYTCGNCLQGELDLREYKNLEIVNLFRHEITSINVESCSKLTHLHLKSNYKHLKSLNLNGCDNLIYLNLEDTETETCFFDFKELPNLVNLYPWNNELNPQLLISKSDLPVWEKFVKAFWINIFPYVNDHYRRIYEYRFWGRETAPNLGLLEKEKFSSIKNLVQDWREEEWGQPETYWNLLQEWVRKMGFDIKKYEEKWQNFSLLWNKKKEQEKKKLESERLITESIDLESNNLKSDEVNKLLENLKINEENDVFFGGYSNQLVKYNQSLTISDQGMLSSILREEREKQKKRCIKEYEELKIEINNFAVVFKQEIGEKKLNSREAYEKLNIFSHKKNSLEKYFKSSEWKEKLQAIDNHLSKIKGIIENYKKLRKVEKEKEETVIKLSETEDLVEEIKKIPEIDDNKLRLIQEEDCLKKKIYKIKKEIKEAKKEAEEKIRKRKEAEKEVAYWTRRKMILEVAIGQEYIHDDKDEDLDEEDTKKEKETKPHEILGVEKNATPEEVKKTYRRLSLQYHPDKQTGKSEEEKKQANEMMAKVNKAYEEITGKSVECEEKLSAEELESIERERKEHKKETWEKIAEEYQEDWEMRDIFYDLANDKIKGSLRRDLSIAIINKRYLEKALRKLEEIIPKLREIAEMMKPEVSFDEQERLLENLLKKNVDISGEIEEIVPFETWFNPNCATVVTEDKNASSSHPHFVWLVVYEPKENGISETISSIKTNSHWNIFLGAKKGAKELRERLENSSNPILDIYPNSSGGSYFSSIVTSPYVINNQVGKSTKNVDIPLFYVNYHSSIPSDLDRHFKPLDIVWVKCVDKWIGKRFYHVGVYVGNDTIFHFSAENDAVERTSWSGFLNNTTRKIIRYHPVVPFKNYKDIIEQLVWAKDNDFRKGNYNLPNRNCEHLANMAVLGINFSQQIHERRDELIAKALAEGTGFCVAGGFFGGASIMLAPATGGLSLIAGAATATAFAVKATDHTEENITLNNNKIGICLEDEIRETNNLLGKKSDSETEQYERWYLQEVPSKENCIIM